MNMSDEFNEQWALAEDALLKARQATREEIWKHAPLAAQRYEMEWYDESERLSFLRLLSDSGSEIIGPNEIADGFDEDWKDEVYDDLDSLASYLADSIGEAANTLLSGFDGEHHFYYIEKDNG